MLQCTLMAESTHSQQAQSLNELKHIIEILYRKKQLKYSRVLVHVFVSNRCAQVIKRRNV